MLESFVEMTNVKKAQIELEDCFGLGLHSYLRKMGGKLEELVISCSSGEEETQNFFFALSTVLFSVLTCYTCCILVGTQLVLN